MPRYVLLPGGTKLLYRYAILNPWSAHLNHQIFKDKEKMTLHKYIIATYYTQYGIYVKRRFTVVADVTVCPA